VNRFCDESVIASASPNASSVVVLAVGARPSGQASRSTPTTTTLAFLKAGYSVRFEPIDAGRREGESKIRLGADGIGFLLIVLKVITIFSPLRIFRRSAPRFSSAVRGHHPHAIARNELVRTAHPAERRHLSQWSRVRADHRYASRAKE
jgi:hypothetical protein